MRTTKKAVYNCSSKAPRGLGSKLEGSNQWSASSDDPPIVASCDYQAASSEEDRRGRHVTSLSPSPRCLFQLRQICPTFRGLLPDLGACPSRKVLHGRVHLLRRLWRYRAGTDRPCTAVFTLQWSGDVVTGDRTGPATLNCDIATSASSGVKYDRSTDKPHRSTGSGRLSII